MKERPILFSAPMVRAILDGTKTQTRRVVKPRADKDMGPRCVLMPHEIAGEVNGGNYRNAYAESGDWLWVREAHWMDRRDTTLAVMNVDGFVVAKNGRETGQESNSEELGLNHFWKQRPSIHMPRWASRITLEVTGVRVERLQDISDGDCLAEGIYPTGTGLYPGAPKAAYQKLWVEINGPGSWYANPWVWVVEFKRLEGGAA